MSKHSEFEEIRSVRGIPRGDFRAQQRPFPGFEEFDQDFKNDSKAITAAAIALVILIAGILVSVTVVVLCLLLKNFG